jgi:hypothetical protein
LLLAGAVLLPAAAQGADPLEQLNAAFGTTYRSAKARQLAGTVIVLDGDRALLWRDGATVAQATVRPPQYHRLKQVDHAVLAMHLKLEALLDAPLSAAGRADLAALRALVEAARSGLDAAFPAGPALQRQQRILLRMRTALDQGLESGRITHAEAAAFAQDLAPLLMANVQDATALQLEALDRAIAAWRRAMPAAEWNRLRVLLMAAHMPRDGEVTWQYFSRLLGQRAEGDRIIYAEGLFTLKDALDLLATHGVDRNLGAAFFQEPERMHRDLLADAARDWLQSHPLLAE